MLETDGTSACLHFQGSKPEKSEIVFPSNPSRVIGIDPGRTNLMYGVEDTPDGKITYKLTRKMYYNSSGMTKRNLRTAKWEKDIAEQELKFREKSIKTTNDDDWKDFISNYISVYDTLWDEKTKRKWSQESFRVYCLRHRTLDKFFQSMKGKKQPVIAFGAAKFNPTGKHELSAPTTSISKRCSKFYKTYLVDEYNTTKICNKCHKRLPYSQEFRYRLRSKRTTMVLFHQVSYFSE